MSKNYTNFNLIDVFPTSIGQSEIYDLEYLNILKNTIIKEYRDDKDYKVDSALGETFDFWQSNPILHEIPIFSKLINFINENISKYMDSLGYIYDGFYMTQCWANVYKKGMAIHEHNHPNNFLSWVFFISGQDAPLVFTQQTLSTIQPAVKFDCLGNSQRIAWKPKAGLLIIWPSYLTHRSLPNKSDELRITISGNIMLKGRIGTEENLDFVKLKTEKYKLIDYELKHLK